MRYIKIGIESEKEREIRERMRGSEIEKGRNREGRNERKRKRERKRGRKLDRERVLEGKTERKRE